MPPVESILQKIVRMDIVAHRFRGNTYQPTTLIEIQFLLRSRHNQLLTRRQIMDLLSKIQDPYRDERDFGPVALSFLPDHMPLPDDVDTQAERERMTAEWNRIGYRGIGNTFIPSPVRLPYLRNLEHARMDCMCETRRDPVKCRMTDQCHWSEEYQMCGTKDEEGDVLYMT
jgi:hypothetical protein